MKRNALLLVAVLGVACSQRSEEPPSSLFVTNVDIPEAISSGQALVIRMTGQLPDPCHGFVGFDATRTVDRLELRALHKVIVPLGTVCGDAIVQVPLEYTDPPEPRTNPFTVVIKNAVDPNSSTVKDLSRTVEIQP